MEPIAVVGIGCRLPGADSPETYWQLLRDGVDAIKEIPGDRWEVDEFYDPEPGKPGKMSTRWGGFLEQVDKFDPGFFGISPREVERMDPQQRLVMEVVWETLENAGIAPDSLAGSQTGVFVGIGNYDYCRLLAKDVEQISAYDGTGNTLSITANRLSYTLDLRGPSVIVETACSSSLVAAHFACHSLQSRESDQCIVGGVSLMLAPEPFITYSHARMMAADGRCKTFDGRADGYVRGEGCGMVVLKRLSDALADGDRIQAVIRGTAINQDGLSNGLTAPNGPSQQVVIRKALQNAGVAPAQVSYVEAHGTGTPLGDPIEFKALKSVLGEARPGDRPCWVGSVKTNIGHLEAASGIASIIKVVLALQHKQIPPHLHMQEINPYISLEDSALKIPTQLQPWPSQSNRIAGVSAFGFGGTNCHIVIEEAHPDFTLPEQDRTAQMQKPVSNEPALEERSIHLLTLSAKSDRALRDLARAYEKAIAPLPNTALADVCFTANTGRSHFDHRLAIAAPSIAQLQQRLAAFSRQKPDGWVHGTLTGHKTPKVAFLFTGQGSQYVQMGRELYETQPTFKAAINRCDQILRSHLKQPLLSVLYPQPAKSSASDLINNTAYTQPALFAVEYALVQLWKSWGVEPGALLGHSVGEYVAACVAGVFSLESGLKLVAARARLMQALPPGGRMVAVFADKDVVAAAIAPYEKVSIAAFNGPNSIVVSGECSAIDAVVVSLEKDDIEARSLKVSHAFHSPLMEPMLAEFEQIATQVEYAPPQIKLVSNVTGEIIGDEISTPEYWRRHVRQPVQFAQGIKTLYQNKYELMVEIGPKPILARMSRYCLPENAVTWAASLKEKQGDWQTVGEAIALLYTSGVAIDWRKFDQGYQRDHLSLPTYPFQRQRYWADIKENAIKLPTGSVEQLAEEIAATSDLCEAEIKLLPKLLSLISQKVKQKARKEPSQRDSADTVKDWFYEIQWQLKPRESSLTASNTPAKTPGSWLVFADTEGIGAALAQRLGTGGHDSFLVYPGAEFSRQGKRTWCINPTSSEDCDRLFKEVSAAASYPLRNVVHLWNLDAASSQQLELSTLKKAQDIGLASVLHLLHSLADSTTDNIDQPKLWLVTQGAIALAKESPAVAQSSVWGLGKVAALEHRELWGALIDLPPRRQEIDIDNLITLLLTEIQSPSGEDCLALRQKQRYVARLVKSQPPIAPPDSPVRPDATYLITGGLGALGLQTGRWLAEQGARHLILVGRKEPSDCAQKAIDRLVLSGAEVAIALADVSDETGLASVMAQTLSTLSPLRGIIHAAGVLDDGILIQQTWPQFERVMAAKVQGAWNLHQLSQSQPLDFFVLFSSAASLIGSPGQGNYAAANAFMDGLAHYRKALNLPALSINWAAWGDSGMAANLENRNQARLNKQGLHALAPAQGFAALSQLLSIETAQMSVLPFDWARFKQQWRQQKPPSLLADLFQSVDESTTRDLTTAENSRSFDDFRQQLKTVSSAKRYELLLDYLQQQAAQVLGLSDQRLDPTRSLYDLGLDSLMAVELTALIKTQLQTDLPIRALIEDPSLNNLIALITQQIVPASATATRTATRAEDILDLQREAVLDETIYPAENSTLSTEPAAIFLTGATGFLGAFLLQELLDRTQADIFCLVRAPHSDQAALRLQENLKTYGLWQAAYYTRIKPILGDLAQPLLGLEASQFDQLAAQMDVIYHNGALLNYVYP